MNECAQKGAFFYASHQDVRISEITLSSSNNFSELTFLIWRRY